MSSLEARLAEIDRLDASVDAALERRERGEALADEARRLSRDLHAYVRAAWHVVEPGTPFRDNWHVGAICEKLEAVSAGEISHLQVWVPPGTMKSRTVSILWPTWEWTRWPSRRYMSGSYDIDLSTELCWISRNLLGDAWWIDRWGDVCELRSDANRKMSYWNDRGGSRLAVSPGSKGSGRHAHRIIIDDPINAKEAVRENVLDDVIDWHDGTLSTRHADPANPVEVIVMQRLHKRDLAGHVLPQRDWEILCLPERYEPKHPFVWPDDPRTDGELLWPERRPAKESDALAATLGSHRAAGQLQQRPTAREGSIIKRHLWVYFPREFLDAAELGDVSKLPSFSSIVCSWDTTFKEKNTSDYVAGTCWGIDGGRRFLLRTFHQQASLSRTKTAMKEMRGWALERWPGAAVWTLVENTANGPEIVAQLKQEIPGVVPTSPSVAADQPPAKKAVRAEACEPDFESRSVLIPGAANSAGSDYDSQMTPPWAQAVVEECAELPNGEYDDLVDSTTQALNFARRPSGGGISRPRGRRVPTPRRAAV